MPVPRISPLPADQRDERVQELLAAAGLGRPDGEPLNLFSTLAHHPRLFKRWMQFGGTLLLGGDLPARDRELLILRTGWVTRAEYEWGQHVIIGKAAGLTDDEILRVTEGPEADGWAPFDAVLLRAVDELHAASRITDETWAALAERYDTHQLIEVPMLVGQYHLVGFTLNSLGVERDPGVGGFPA
ncbi:MAG: 4-carboxymuconolactone decarboxylase [Actinomycetota bacterium]|nr:4-carboxymuconolactone decarboxylase [Actinomycetota bacterium]